MKRIILPKTVADLINPERRLDLQRGVDLLNAFQNLRFNITSSGKTVQSAIQISQGGALLTSAATIGAPPPAATSYVLWNYVPAGGSMAVISTGATISGGIWTFPVTSQFAGGAFDAVRVRLYDLMNVLVTTVNFSIPYNATFVNVTMGTATHGIMDILPGSAATTAGYTIAPMTFHI